MQEHITYTNIVKLANVAGSFSFSTAPIHVTVRLVLLSFTSLVLENMNSAPDYELG